MEIKTGDIYQLGDHKLICGNSRDESIVKELIGKEKIRMVCTDPPYNVSYVENKDWVGMRGGKQMEHKKIENDTMSGDEYVEFTRAWAEPMVPFMDSYNSAYIFNSDLMICEAKQGLKQTGFYYSQMIIWVKNQVVLGRKDYNPQHELIIYGWYGRHKFERGKARSIVFCPRPSKAKLHPTMKPVSLLRKLILNSTKINDIVYDPFGGSGSTLIACEHVKRKCLMIEIDPAYCETIIARWEKLTGQKAQMI